MSIQDAVILAAGMGSRMRRDGVETEIHKPFIEVGGRTILSRNLEILAACGVTRVTLVVGCRHEAFRAEFERQIETPLEVRFVLNDEWRLSNGVSLLKAEGATEGDFLLLMGDHLLEPALLGGLVEADHGSFGVVLAVDRKIDQVFDLDDATKVLTDGRRVLDIGKEITNFNAIDTGVFLCTPAVFGALTDARQAQGGDCSLSDGMQRLAAAGRFVVHDVGAARWQDVDTPEMKGNAELWFGAPGDEEADR
jgi:1L-myo-inositol 1-phosphate cytidylyltransferase